MRLTFVMFISIFFLTKSIAQEQPKPYKNQLLAVENKLKIGDFTGAIQELDKITTEYPDAADVYYAKSLLFAQMRNMEQAIANAQMAYQKEPNLMYAKALMDFYKSNNNLPAAIDLLQDLRQRNPKNTEIARELMMTMHNAGQSEQALQVYDQITGVGLVSDTLDVIKAEILVDIKKGDEAKMLLNKWIGKSKIRQVYSTLAYIYINDKKIKEAVSMIELGLKESQDPVLYLDLADAYKASNKSKQSFEALQQAFNSDKVEFFDKHRVLVTLMTAQKSYFSMDQLQLLANSLVLKHPRIAESHVVKGEVLWRKGNVQEARSLFLTAVSMNPQHVDAWRMLINTDLTLDDQDMAVRHGMEALQVNPQNAMLMYFTGLAYMVKEDYANTRVMLERALDNSQEDNAYLQSIIYSSLGDLYHQIQMHRESDVAYDEAIRLDSTNTAAMNNLAYYLSLRKKDLDKAAKYAKQANELNPSSSTFQDTYAWVLFQQEKYSEALVWIQKAIKSSTSSALLYEHYGDILSKVGNTKEAIRQWEKALSIGGDTGMDVEKVKIKIKEKTYVD